MQFRSAKSFTVWASILSMSILGGCQTIGGNSSGLAGGEISSDIPLTGIQSVSSVVVAPAGTGTYVLTAAADAQHSFQDIIAVLYCRAKRHARSNQFDGWFPVNVRQKSTGSANSPLVGEVTVQMYNGDPPEGKKPVTKDWCKLVPVGARA